MKKIKFISLAIITFTFMSCNLGIFDTVPKGLTDKNWKECAYYFKINDTLYDISQLYLSDVCDTSISRYNKDHTLKQSNICEMDYYMIYYWKCSKDGKYLYESDYEDFADTSNIYRIDLITEDSLKLLFLDPNCDETQGIYIYYVALK